MPLQEVAWGAGWATMRAGYRVLFVMLRRAVCACSEQKWRGVANSCLAAVADDFLLIGNDTHGLATSSSSTR